MTKLNAPAIRWGVSGTPWTHDVDIHAAELGVLDFRHNWCRFNPANWSTPGHNAGNWTLKDNARLAEEIIGRGGRFIEVLIDRQGVLSGNGDETRLLIARAIATWDSPKLALLRDEIREVRAAMPNEVYGEIWNGDEFGPGCGFPWDPLKPEFWQESDKPKPPDTTIRARFTRFANEIAALWGRSDRVIRSSSHVYMYVEGDIRHRIHKKVQPIVTECGIYAGHFHQPEKVIQLNSALLTNGVKWAFWHQPYPGNPGDGGAYQAGNKFMYDGDRYREWLGDRLWPEWDGVMLRIAGQALRWVFHS